MDSKSKAMYERAQKECRDELTDYVIYRRLSKIEKDPKLVATFSELAKMEHAHYLFWKDFSDSEVQEKRLTVYLVLLMRYLLGASFIIKYLEGGESRAIRKYEALKRIVPKRHYPAFERMVKDEKDHELAFADKIQAGHVRYISFVVLGLADALVEIAGIQAGSLGVYASTKLTGLAVLVAGAAASIAMASAAYAQAEHGFVGSRSRAAMYTGLSYFASALVLATPYFLTGTLALAIVVSIMLGMVLIAFVSWYNSVMSKSKFAKDFASLAGVMLLATVALFIIGLGIRHLFGITI